MPQPLTPLLPDSLWFPNKKPEVIRFLQLQPAPSNVRRDWLFLWALWVGSRVNRYDYAAVQKDSLDL